MPTGNRPTSRTSPFLAAQHRGISAIAPRQLVGTIDPRHERCVVYPAQTGTPSSFSHL